MFPIEVRSKLDYSSTHCFHFGISFLWSLIFSWSEISFPLFWNITNRQAVDDYVRSGMVVGLGTGSTAYFAVERVGEKVRQISTSDSTVVMIDAVKLKNYSEELSYNIAKLSWLSCCCRYSSVGNPLRNNHFQSLLFTDHLLNPTTTLRFSSNQAS